LAVCQIAKLLKSGKKDVYDTEYLKQLQSGYGFIFEAIQILGKKRIKELDYKESAIKTELAAVQRRREFLKPEIVNEIHNHFKTNTWHRTSDINTALTDIYTRHGIALTKRVILFSIAQS
jgi:hypothetical protein